jgi:surfeit locus 1 family protein
MSQIVPAAETFLFCLHQFSHLMPSLTFHPRLIPTLAALCALAATLYLAAWQQGRAAEKRALQAAYDQRSAMPPLALSGADVARMDPQSARFRRAAVSGEWLESGQIFVDNKFEQNAVGYHVLTPLRIAGTQRYVLVNRGWVSRGANYPLPPKVAVESGEVNVRGTIIVPTSKFLELGQETVSGNVWQNVTIERFRAVTKLDVLPVVLLASPAGAGLRVVTEQPDAGVAKHVEYMLTWYSLALTIGVLWIALNLKIRRNPVATAAPNESA